MSVHMKKRLTKDVLSTLVRDKEINIKSSMKSSFANHISELVVEDVYTAEEVHGEWLDDPRMRVAKYLRGTRSREGFSQKEVCKKLGIPQSNLSKLENGERPIPGHLIPKFAKLYKIKSKMITEKSEF